MSYRDDPDFMAWASEYLREPPPLPTATKTLVLPLMYEAWKAGRAAAAKLLRAEAERDSPNTAAWRLRRMADAIERSAIADTPEPEPVATTEELLAGARQLRDAAAAIGITDPNDAEFSLEERGGRTVMVVQRKGQP